jgi:hypothetical protein
MPAAATKLPVEDTASFDRVPLGKDFKLSHAHVARLFGWTEETLSALISREDPRLAKLRRIPCGRGFSYWESEVLEALGKLTIRVGTAVRPWAGKNFNGHRPQEKKAARKAAR